MAKKRLPPMPYKYDPNEPPGVMIQGHPVGELTFERHIFEPDETPVGTQYTLKVWCHDGAHFIETHYDPFLPPNDDLGRDRVRDHLLSEAARHILAMYEMLLWYV